MAITAEEYLEWILARIDRTPTQHMPLRGAFGLALAEAVSARVDLPLWNSSAMDGYAIRAADVAGAQTDVPVQLRVTGEVAAGDAEDPELAAGCAIRIMTGAPVPSAADAVVPIERTRPVGNGEAGFDVGHDETWDVTEILLSETVRLGANIRQQGEDTKQGEVLAEAGDTLNAALMSALAASGTDVVMVHRAPRVAVLSTGAELRAAGGSLQRGEIPESNSLLLAGLLREAGLQATTVEHSADSPDALKAQIDRLAATHDVVLTTGGVGPGKYDVVRIALADEAEIAQQRVLVRPGQPQCSGRLHAGAFFFGLPGNPVSAAVSFELFVRPALRFMAGHRLIKKRRLPATAAVDWPGKLGSLQVLPVTIEELPVGLRCAPAVPATSVSHSVAHHGASQGYALVEADRGDVRAGEMVQLIEMGWR